MREPRRLARREANDPVPYVYYVTGDPGGPYRWPVNNDAYIPAPPP